MDISLFSKCLKESVLECDSVCIPGLGSFFVKLEDAYLSDNGTVINPPFRKISFCPDAQGDKGLFLGKISSTLPAGSKAEEELDEVVKKIHELLAEGENVAVEGLGTFSHGESGEVLFSAEEVADIFPEGFGLKPVEVTEKPAPKESQKPAVAPERQNEPQNEQESQMTRKERCPQPQQSELDEQQEPQMTRKEQCPQPPQSELDEQQELQKEQQDQPAEPQQKHNQQESAEPQRKLNQQDHPAEPQQTAQPQPRRKHVLGWIIIVLLACVIIAAAAAYFFKDVPWVSDLLDRMLYSEEELQLIQMFKQ